MSTKLPTEVKAENSTKNTTIDIKRQLLKPNVPISGHYHCEFAKRESKCLNIKNPWVLRVASAFVVCAILVVYGTLYSRLGEKMEASVKTITELENLINGIQERIENLEMRLNKRLPNGPSKNKVESVVSPREKNDNNQSVSNTLKRSPFQRVRGKAKSKNKNRKKSKSAQVVYTYWGKNTCLDTDFRVYEGQVAGSSLNHAGQKQGGGTNYICMKGVPRYIKFTSSSNYDSVSLYPVRFGHVSNVLTHLWSDKQSLDLLGVSCAVCLTNDPVVMMPGTKDCPVKWKKHYFGYLMAQAQNGSASEFICVDTKSKGRPNTKSSSRGRPYLSLVQYKCPDSSCGEYQQHTNKPIPCAVCSKTI